MKLKIEHVHLSFFGHEECLHDINLSFGEGTTVLYGERGSGKTALLKCIARINDYAGDIELDGNPLKTGKEGDVCMVFDDLALFKRRSLYYNLTYPLRIRKVPKQEWPDLLAPLLKRWGLEKVILDNPAYRAPADIQVRLALARAGLMPRKVLLLDNPLGKLRPDDRRAVWGDMSKFIRNYPGVVIYATDDIDEVRSLDCPVAVLSGGYLVANDKPDTLASTLPSVYVATRLVPYWKAIEGVADKGIVHTEEEDLVANYPPTYEGKRVLVGIAPSAYRVTKGGDRTVCNAVYMGGRTYSVLERGDESIVVEGKWNIGEAVSAAIEGVVPVYDIKSEWRIDGFKGEEK